MSDRFTTAPSMEANETLILDRGVVSLRSVNLMTHADYAEIVCRGLNVLDRNGMLPAVELDEEDPDTVLVPDAAEQAASQHPRAAGRVEPTPQKVAGRAGGSEC